VDIDWVEGGYGLTPRSMGAIWQRYVPKWSYGAVKPKCERILNLRLLLLFEGRVITHFRHIFSFL